MNILTMNQNVFGSSFETTRRTNFTENAINSELIIPDSAVELGYEEMEYIDGGAISVRKAAALIDIGLFVIAGAFSAASFFGKKAAKKFVQNNIYKIISISVQVLGYADTGAALLQNVLTVFDVAFEWGSLGSIVANLLDFADGNRNGILWG